jgi:hypothetical protein
MDIANMVWQRDELAKSISKRYEIDVWVSINQYVNISWESWHDLDDLVKRAIGLEIEEIARSKQQAVRDQEMKLENLMAKDSASLKFPNPTTPAINKFLS